MGRRKHKKTKVMYRVDSVEDLRGMENAPADFRLTFWLSNFKSYRLLFDFEENDSELTLTQCEIDGVGPLTNAIVEIPQKVEGYPVTKIKGFAFKWALNQESLSIPNNIRSIGGNAFCGCTIHDLFIPASVSEIGVPAFQNSAIYNIRIDEGNKQFDSRNDCNAIIDTTKNELIAGGINTIIPDTVTSIGCDAFYMYQDLKEIIIPQSISKIGDHAFCGCFPLEKVNIASSLIGESAFSGCEDLKEMVLSDTVTTISKRAFSSCYSLKEVIIPSSVAVIEAEAFKSCCGLEKLVIPVSVEEIGEGTFRGCENLKEVQIPNSVKVIGASAFSGCESLEQVVIPDSVEEIGEGTFCGCKNLKEVQIPNSVIRIGANAFRECKGLKKVVIPDSVTFIGLSAFLGCDEAQIIIKNSSLLKAAFQLSIDELLKRKRNESLGNQKDSELLRLELQRCFRNIYWEFYKNLNDDGGINNALLSSIQWKTKLSNGRNVFDSISFVKSIHLFSFNIWNDYELFIDKKNVEQYSDRQIIYGKDFDYVITDNKDGLNPSNPVLDSSVFVYASPNSDKKNDWDLDLPFYSLLEYSTSPSETILNGKYHAVIEANKDEEGELHHEASPYLQATCDVVVFFEENRRLFHQMDLCSDVFSNYFFVSSYFSDPREQADCLLLASIGIDKKAKTKADEVRVFLTEFRSFMDSISQLISFSIQTHEHRQHALESAIAKVMARNMSHNIGSHVFSHLVGDRAYEKLSDKSVAELDSYISCYEEPKKDERAKYAVNHQLSLFNRYLKNRMDYLSEVTFSVSSTVVTKSVYGEVFKELDNVRILLNHISGIADFKFGFSLMHNGVSLSEEDILVAFPGDVLGCQAFFNIIENIIRNTAKHATKKDQNPVMFNINFIDKKDFPDYFCVEIDNGIKEPSIKRLVNEQNKIIGHNILDRDFNLRTNGLGIVEMKTSCAYLRQLNMSAVDSKKYSTDRYYNRKDHPDDWSNHYGNLILLKAINKKGALGYRFFMQKPKEFLLIGDFDVADSQKDVAGKEGVQFISEEKFAKALGEGKSFPHPFLVYLNNVADKTKELLSDDSDCKTLLPIRKLRASQEDAKSIINIINNSGRNKIAMRMKEYVWIKYYESVIAKELKNPSNEETIIVTELDGFSSPINNQVVFLNHATKSQHEECWQLFQNDHSFEGWIENLSSRTSSKLPEFSKYSTGTNNEVSAYVLNIENVKPLNYEIFEAYHNKVLVLDERVQKFSQENSEGSSGNEEKIPCSKLFESTHVLIPNTPLDPNAFDEEYIDEIEQFIDNNMDNAYILIHYGILERMYRNESIITEKLCTWAKGSKRLVVTSGRGAHSLTLPPSVCFVNLSSVLYAFTEGRNKFIINNLLNQTRRKNG